MKKTKFNLGKYLFKSSGRKENPFYKQKKNQPFSSLHDSFDGYIKYVCE